MNGLTTIAALPSAAGSKASLSAEKVRANAPAVVPLKDYFGAGKIVHVSGLRTGDEPIFMAAPAGQIREMQRFIDAMKQAHFRGRCA